MAEAKVRLSFMVQGATMLSSQECEKNPKDSYNYTKVVLESQNKKGYKDRETITVATRKSIPAVQSLIISADAYSEMISSKNVPSKFTRSMWAKMTNAERLDFHMNEIAESLGGYNPTYQVLDD